MKTRRQIVMALALTTAMPAAFTEEPGRRVPVTLQDGRNSRSFEDRISDFESVSYAMQLRQGQTLHVVLATDNASSCFDIYAPDAPKPVYVGGDSGNDYKLLATKKGEYLVKVFLLRLAARDGQTATYTLELTVTG